MQPFSSPLKRFRMGCHWLDSNSWSPCLSVPSSGITGMQHHISLGIHFLNVETELTIGGSDVTQKGSTAEGSTVMEKRGAIFLKYSKWKNELPREIAPVGSWRTMWQATCDWRVPFQRSSAFLIAIAFCPAYTQQRDTHQSPVCHWTFKTTGGRTPGLIDYTWKLSWRQ